VIWRGGTIRERKWKARNDARLLKGVKRCKTREGRR
jgi:hypothetical protein